MILLSIDHTGVCLDTVFFRMSKTRNTYFWLLTIAGKRMNTEKRNRSRRYIDTSIKILEGIGCYYNAIGADVSLGGLCFITAKPDLEEGQTVMIQFDLPIKGRVVNVHGEAKIIYKTSVGLNAIKVGLAFVNLDTISTWNVEAYMNSAPRLASDEPSKEYVWNSLSNFSSH